MRAWLIRWVNADEFSLQLLVESRFSLAGRWGLLFRVPPHLGHIAVRTDSWHHATMLLPTRLLKQIKLNKDEVSIVAGESAEVLVMNSAPGAMNLSAKALSEGVEAKLEKSTLQSNETGVLKMSTTKGARPGVVNLTVEQTGYPHSDQGEVRLLPDPTGRGC